MALQQQEFPLFPLNVVLFPGMELPLHIFEERYKLMIRQCLEGDRIFGVVLINSGSEVGEPAVPFSVGTLAHIEGVEPLLDGRMNLRTRGQRRFRTHQIVQQHPYLRGVIEVLSEDDGGQPVRPDLVEEVREMTGAYLKAVIALRGGWLREIPLPQESQALSYFVAGSLMVANPLRQELLEMVSVQERLERELSILRQEQPRIQKELQERHNKQGPRRN